MWRPLRAKSVQLTRISLDLRVRLDPSILTATTTDPDPRDLNTTNLVTVNEHSLEGKKLMIEIVGRSLIYLINPNYRLLCVNIVI